MSSHVALSGTREGVVRRFHMGDGSMMQLRHMDGSTEAVLYWLNRRTKPQRVERSSARFQSLPGAIKAVLEDAGLPDTSEHVAAYVRSTRWGEGWPN